MRTLTIRMERLSELTSTDLAAVGGGAKTTDCLPASILDGACQLPTLDCFTGIYPTLDGCPTIGC